MMMLFLHIWWLFHATLLNPEKHSPQDALIYTDSYRISVIPCDFSSVVSLIPYLAHLQSL